MLKFLTVMMLGCMVGCAAPLKTPSGRPEITVRAASHEYIESRVIDHFVDEGYQPTPVDRLNIRFEKAAGFGESMAYGTMLQPTCYYRVYVTILDEPDGTFRITARTMIVQNRGNAFEGEMALKDTYDQTLQKDLEAFAQRISVPGG